MNPILKKLRVKIFADGAEKSKILELCSDPLIAGFTTNPTLMRKAGVPNYEEFAKDVLSVIKDRPVSFEVFSDDFAEMERQARTIAGWGDNVYIKIPITNTKGESSLALVERLSASGVRVNVTALMTMQQVRESAPALKKGPASYISIFAGRIADAGIDPVPMMKEAVDFLRAFPHIQLIWASPREVLNVIQADAVGCDIITMTNDLLKKLSLFGKDLNEFSLETVKMFHDDAKAAGYKI